MASQQPECAICGGSGWLRVERALDDPRFGKLEPCDCQGQSTLAQMRALAGLTEAEAQMTLSKLYAVPGSGTERMLAACRDFIARPRGFLTLWGGVGNGKSSCLQAITNALLSSGSLYISLHELLAHVKGGFDSTAPGDSAHVRMQRFETVPILCLDEVDKVHTSGWVSEQLTALVDVRFRSGLAEATGTVLALNSNPAAQPAWIASRLADGRCRMVHNADGDARYYKRPPAPEPPALPEPEAPPLPEREPVPDSEVEAERSSGFSGAPHD